MVCILGDSKLHEGYLYSRKQGLKCPKGTTHVNPLIQTKPFLNTLHNDVNGFWRTTAKDDKASGQLYATRHAHQSPIKLLQRLGRRKKHGSRKGKRKDNEQKQETTTHPSICLCTLLCPLLSQSLHGPKHKTAAMQAWEEGYLYAVRGCGIAVHSCTFAYSFSAANSVTRCKS